MCYLVIHVWPGDDDISRETTVEAGLQNKWVKFQRLTTVDGERSETKMTKENKKKMTGTMTNLTPADRDAKNSTVKKREYFLPIKCHKCVGKTLPEHSDIL